MDELEKILNNLEAEERNLLATKTIIVLGAGASFGSSLVNKHLRPPLINEFLKVANELWDFLGNDGAYEELLNCFERAGIELREEIDTYFSKFK